MALRVIDNSVPDPVLASALGSSVHEQVTLVFGGGYPNGGFALDQSITPMKILTLIPSDIVVAHSHYTPIFDPVAGTVRLLRDAGAGRLVELEAGTQVDAQISLSVLAVI